MFCLPLPFNPFSQRIFEGDLKDEEVDIKINGEVVNNVRYADDSHNSRQLSSNTASYLEIND